ncbi:hypothetical protein RRG08_053910 [Elysia crispata]|uniref:Uncharacterized protein n=1 Tax=Elysia crispata TaxID=231223 RepID=A0AAE1DIG0_9GAST|nr:hypothetical protein RRG08_053910 [Elysia crispata]
MSNLDPNDSDFLTSGDEYQPSANSDSDDSDIGKPKKPTKKKQTLIQRKDDDSDDDVPTNPDQGVNFKRSRRGCTARR